MSSKIQPAVPKKSKKSSKQDELIYKNKIKEDGQDERLKEKQHNTAFLKTTILFRRP